MIFVFDRNDIDWILFSRGSAIQSPSWAVFEYKTGSLVTDFCFNGVLWLWHSLNNYCTLLYFPSCLLERDHFCSCVLLLCSKTFISVKFLLVLWFWLITMTERKHSLTNKHNKSKSKEVPLCQPYKQSSAELMQYTLVKLTTLYHFLFTFVATTVVTHWHVSMAKSLD